MPWHPQKKDRKKALALVLLLHLALGAALLHGLAGEPLRQTSQALTTFDVRLPDSLTPPAPARDEKAAIAREAGSTDLEALPAAIVQPPRRVKLARPPLLRTADEAATRTGQAPSAAAGTEAGVGRGAGPGGDGTGGGGSGGSGAGGLGTGSEARLISGNLSRRDYRQIREFGAPRGQAVLAIEVGPDGRLASCQPASSSGNPALDYELCRLLARTRWQPARDREGRAIPVTLRYVATWDRV
jgi:protein TonB